MVSRLWAQVLQPATIESYTVKMLIIRMLTIFFTKGRKKHGLSGCIYFYHISGYKISFCYLIDHFTIGIVSIKLTP